MGSIWEEDPTLFEADEIFKTRVELLQPTQFYIGQLEIEKKVAEISKLSNEERLSTLREDPIKVVIGPDGEIFTIDNHHLALAIWSSGHSKVYAKIVANHSEMGITDFWQWMKSQKLVYLYDYKLDKVRSWKELPYSLDQMQDDPWRSLAWFVRKKGGYKKTLIPFAEFYWARFFQKKLSFNAQRFARDAKYFTKAIEAGVLLAKQPSAKSLPGYNGNSKCDLKLKK